MSKLVDKESINELFSSEDVKIGLRGNLIKFNLIHNCKFSYEIINLKSKIMKKTRMEEY